MGRHVSVNANAKNGPPWLHSQFGLDQLRVRHVALTALDLSKNKLSDLPDGNKGQSRALRRQPIVRLFACLTAYGADLGQCCNLRTLDISGTAFVHSRCLRFLRAKKVAPHY